MIKIEFSEPSSKEWQEWKRRCERATKEHCAARAKGTRPDFNEKLYKEMWSIYLSPDGPFHGKCAYCEAFIAADQPGDIDHFRPKAEVTDIEGKVVAVDDGQSDPTSHPGYYWLAYDWRNLLPACAECNRPSKRKTKGTNVGKGTRFPVSGKYAICLGGEDCETPLLINPAAPAEDPKLHMTFDELGVLYARTERGAACEEVFGLNKREALIRERKRAFDEAYDAVMTLIDAARAVDKDRFERSAKKLQAFKIGRAAYSASGRTGMEKRLAIDLPTQYSLIDTLKALAASPCESEQGR